MTSLYPSIKLTDQVFQYTSAAKTDIRETFKRFSATKNQENNKPLVPILPQNGFVLSAEWFEIE
jgi:hypothetical protein